MIREIVLADVPTLTEIHLSSWAPNELSVKLGAEFVGLFYERIVKSAHSFGYVYELDGTIVGYAVGFHDYHAFNAEISKLRLIRILLKKLPTGKISIPDMVNLLLDNRKLRNAHYPHYHLGSLALANPYKGTPEGRTAITETINAVIGRLESEQYPGCWGLCDEENMPMRKYLVKLGFDEVDIVPLMGKKVVLYEKKFPSEA